MLGNPDLGKFDCGIKNAGFWNSEHNSRNPKSHPTMRGIQNPSFADKAWNPVLEIVHPRWGMQSPRLSCISLEANRLSGFKYTSRPFSAKFAISFGVFSGYFRTFPFRCLFIDFVLVIRHIKTQHYGSIFCALFSFNWLIRGQPRSSWPTVLLQKGEGRLGDLV